MLSLRRCREILADQQDLNDEQLRELRDTLYALAEVVLDIASDDTRGTRAAEMMGE